MIPIPILPETSHVQTLKKLLLEYRHEPQKQDELKFKWDQTILLVKQYEPENINSPLNCYGETILHHVVYFKQLSLNYYAKIADCMMFFYGPSGRPYCFYELKHGLYFAQTLLDLGANINQSPSLFIMSPWFCAKNINRDFWPLFKQWESKRKTMITLCLLQKRIPLELIQKIYVYDQQNRK